MTLLANVLNSGANYKDGNREKYRLNFINVIILLATPLFFIYTLLNLNKHIYLVATIDAIITLVLTLTFIYLRKTQNASKAAYVLLILPLPIYFTMMTHGGGLYQSAFFWYFFYPLFALLLKGNKKGLPWIALHIFMILGYYLYIQLNHIPQSYHPNLLIVLVAALALESLIIMYYERIRKLFDKIIIAQNKELHKLKQQLENQVIIQNEKNTLLASELVEIQKDIIFTMGTIGERRSHETGDHVKRVSAYAKLLGQKYGLDKETVMMLEQASPMHDIGKVGIADAILHKPGKLTPEEFEIMKTHAELGYEMLKSSNRSLLKMAATIAYEHHEHYDGSGYPRGLKGKEIDICARITTLADVFDALGHDRVYKKAWDNERIFTYIHSASGSLFDPKLVALFFDHIDEFLAIKAQYTN